MKRNWAGVFLSGLFNKGVNDAGQIFLVDFREVRFGFLGKWVLHLCVDFYVSIARLAYRDLNAPSVNLNRAVFHNLVTLKAYGIGPKGKPFFVSKQGEADFVTVCFGGKAVGGVVIHLDANGFCNISDIHAVSLGECFNDIVAIHGV